MPQNTGLPELKALNPDHCFVAALGKEIRLKASNIYIYNIRPPTHADHCFVAVLGMGIRLKASKIYS
jgi:hypothetical protein